MSDTILKKYFETVSEVPLLSSEEEKELAESIFKWRTNRKAGEATRKKGIEAKEKMIKSNLRLVIKIANKYKGYGIDVSDLISEGNMGLIEGIEKFDPNRGVKLATYASWWIKQHIRRALSNKSRTIRVPVPVLEEKNKINKFKNTFEKKNNREPSFEEIRKEFNFPREKLRRLLETGQAITSLEANLGQKDTLSLADVIEDVSIEDPAFVAEKKDELKVIKKILNKLNERERAIIIKRFGLNNEDKDTLENIGKIHGVTRERIRQVEILAMNKLKFYIKKEMKSIYD